MQSALAVLLSTGSNPQGAMLVIAGQGNSSNSILVLASNLTRPVAWFTNRQVGVTHRSESATPRLQQQHSTGKTCHPAGAQTCHGLAFQPGQPWCGAQEAPVRESSSRLPVASREGQRKRPAVQLQVLRSMHNDPVPLTHPGPTRCTCR